ncbi:MAG: methylenetetrahydrofolate reductase [NAD(P)H] [Phycisphaerae bacterium]|nr:methylenetetrahydrofolate reductase [NAD(P)H] [Phycisphaerae bacterium]MDW8263302.1 methylenetetrahydrofolate reductase [NAD(P)H] [Phycisphaerales bacterium]
MDRATDTQHRIDSVLGKGPATISFEFFPPKTDTGWAQLYGAIAELHAIRPAYVSVTYGAGGSTRARTVELVARIQRELNLRSMAHLTCVGHTAEELGGILADLWSGGVRNILALRGDPPAGQTWFTPTAGGFSHADELVAFIRSRYDFCIGVAGYPEGHPQCLNKTRDLEHLKRKLDNGAQFVVTQLFFDNDVFYWFRDAARKMGITAPIVAGIMPITNVSQIKRFVSMCGAKIHHKLLLKLESVENDPEATARTGVDYAIEQCTDLLRQGVDGLHFYTLNKSKATVEICRALEKAR